jgi:cytochrome d ubiquinol oxidase subunit II
VAWGDLGFRIVGVADPQGMSNPLRTAVVAAPGAWLDNYGLYPWMIAAPVLGLVGVVAALVGLWRRSEPLAFVGSGVSVIGIISTVGLSMFPFILPSSIDPASSLTVWNSSSTHLTLFIMLGVTIVFLPVILIYTAWVYKVLWGRTSTAALKTNPDLY